MTYAAAEIDHDRFLTTPLSEIAVFPTVVGTQTIGPAYHFTDQPPLIETARAIAAMGCQTLKLSLARHNYACSTGHAPAAEPMTLRDLARSDAVHRATLDMPFAHTLLWAYPWQGDEDHGYREIYDLTAWLLTQYTGSRRTFYLGNWEGDWELLHIRADHIPTQAEVRHMIDRTLARQRAVDDAKRDTPHADVQAYHYLEVNRVADAMNGLPRVANLVLPETPVDFVSYSAYDAIRSDVRQGLPAALNFLEAQLPHKRGVTGRRVFVGEYGFPLSENTPAEQDRRSREVMRIALAWGCRFCLYWEMYNNERTPDGTDIGYAMIDHTGTKLPVYHTHAMFFEKARQWIEAASSEIGRMPTAAEFAAAGRRWLDLY